MSIIKAVVFDMDGVITDTEKLLVKYWCMAANELGFPMQPCHAIEIRSLAGKLTEPLLKGYFGEEFDYSTVRARRMELMNADIERNGLQKKAGLDFLLDYLEQHNYRRAVATATDPARAKMYLSRINVYEKFDRVISAAMVENGKPYPDIYLYAAEQLGLKPCECVALEDSPNGVKSACAAGMNTIMIPDLTQPDDELNKIIFRKCDDLFQVAKVLEQLERSGATEQNQ